MAIVCEDILSIDFQRLAKQLLPHFWRDTIFTDADKVIWVNYYCMLFSQLQYSNDDLVIFCAEIRNRLGYSGQHLALEELLNDNYDPDLRRIYIEELNNPQAEGTSIALNNEDNPYQELSLSLNNEVNDTPFWIALNSEINDPDNLYFISFIIHIPISITVTDVLINALVAIYAIAPKRWIIVRF
jgi:hypothetical protein